MELVVAQAHRPGAARGRLRGVGLSLGVPFQQESQHGHVRFQQRVAQNAQHPASGEPLDLRCEIDRATRYGLELSVCFIDLDGFKAINDSEGHEAGNEVLAVLGERLREAARSTDIVGRYGGDEFVLVLPETGLRSATRLAKRLRGALATMATPAGSSLSASARVAQWRRGVSSNALVEAADAALLRAKERDSGLELAR